MRDPDVEAVWVGLMPSPGRHDPADWYYALDRIERRLARIAELEAAIGAALLELGEPDRMYPAPVANAVGILRAALAKEKEERYLGFGTDDEEAWPDPDAKEKP